MKPTGKGGVLRPPFVSLGFAVGGGPQTPPPAGLGAPRGKFERQSVPNLGLTLPIPSFRRIFVFVFLSFPALDLGRSSWPPPTARPMKKVGTVKSRWGSPFFSWPYCRRGPGSTPGPRFLGPVDSGGRNDNGAGYRAHFMKLCIGPPGQNLPWWLSPRIPLETDSAEP